MWELLLGSLCPHCFRQHQWGQMDGLCVSSVEGNSQRITIYVDTLRVDTSAYLLIIVPNAREDLVTKHDWRLT